MQSVLEEIREGIMDGDMQLVQDKVNEALESDVKPRLSCERD